MRNRLSKVFEELDQLKVLKSPKSKCVIVCCKDKAKITYSYRGVIHTWEWIENKGIKIDDTDVVFAIHPMAAEAYVIVELYHYINQYEIDSDDLIFVDDIGRTTNEIVFHPPELGKETKEMSDLKVVLTSLFLSYTRNDMEVTQEMLNLAEEHGVLQPFLSLINNL